MTPSKAIRIECAKYCKNGTHFVCKSDLCKLNDFELTPLKRIKAHCITCVPSQNLEGVRQCKGYVDNPEPHTCPLWEYRLGKNPKRSGINAKTQHLNRFKFSKHTANEQKKAQI